MRQAAGLSREKLAASAGVHKCTIEAIEMRGVLPSLPVYYRLCTALEVDAGPFFVTKR